MSLLFYKILFTFHLLSLLCSRRWVVWNIESDGTTLKIVRYEEIVDKIADTIVD